jgi:drug/metabolite transporter (DMT)-like permease
VFGIVLVWLGAGEKPSSQVMVGGMMVLATLALNEWIGMRGRSGTSTV